MKDINMVRQMYWHVKRNTICFNTALCSRRMLVGFEWNDFQNGKLTCVSGFENELVSMYEIMSTFDVGSVEAEAAMFEKIMTLYQSDESIHVAKAMFAEAAAIFLSRHNDKL
jgi:hypothetical protein